MATYFVGPHVSAGGGVSQASLHAKALNASAFALFVKNQRQWAAPPLPKAEIDAFKTQMAEDGFTSQQVLPHAGYLINLANPDDGAQEKSFAALLDEATRCFALGLSMINFHPGSHLRLITPQAACERVAGAINRAMKAIEEICFVVENTAGSGGNIGSRFEELKIILDGIDDRSRVGFCLDTCHTFAAGYDISTRDGFLKTLDAFDACVGMNYLRAMHLNDSKTALGSHVDRHESLGKGLLGIEPFKCLMRDTRFQKIPLILETPDETLWAEEIKLLRSFV
ncbi:MAG: deoxyribonuclease IV [bacterium]